MYYFHVFSQALVSQLTVDLILFIMDRGVWPWNYCYNSLYHKGELKGKVLNAGLRKDQTKLVQRGIHFPLHQPSGRMASQLWVPDVVTHQSYSIGPTKCIGQLFLSDWGCTHFELKDTNLKLLMLLIQE